VDLDPSRASGQIADQLGRDALFRRHLSGHVHQSPFVKDGSWVDRIGPTWVFNAGQQFGAPPTHIIIDTEVGEALWFSSAGNQYIRFSEPLERPVPRLEGIPDWLKAEDRPQPPGRM
jgi:hypothetical protein